MKNSAFLLSKMYLKHNFKKYIKIIILFSLSFIILILSLYFSLSYNLEYKSKLNKNKIFLSSEMYTDNLGYNHELINMLNEDDAISNYIYYKNLTYSYCIKNEGFGFSGKRTIYYPHIVLDELNFEYKNSGESDDFSVYNDLSLSFDKCEYDYLKKNNKELILSGDLSDVSQNDIVISSKVCELYNISAKDIIGKKFSYILPIYNIESREVENNTIISNFNIKAVFDYKALECLVSRNDDVPLALLENDVESDFLADTRFINYKITFYFKNYNSFNKGIDNYINYFEQNKLNEGKYILLSYNNTINNFINDRDLIELSTKILYFICGLICVIMVLNLFNLNYYINKKRYNFLNICGYIGLNNKNKRRFSLYENTLLFGFISFISIVLSFVIAFIFTSKFNVSYISGEFYEFMVLNMKYYVFVVILYLIGLSLFLILFHKFFELLFKKKYI